MIEDGIVHVVSGQSRKLLQWIHGLGCKNVLSSNNQVVVNTQARLYKFVTPLSARLYKFVTPLSVRLYKFVTPLSARMTNFLSPKVIKLTPFLSKIVPVFQQGCRSLLLSSLQDNKNNVLKNAYMNSGTYKQ